MNDTNLHTDNNKKIFVPSISKLKFQVDFIFILLYLKETETQILFLVQLLKYSN